jgi:hypothetical protein
MKISRRKAVSLLAILACALFAGIVSLRTPPAAEPISEAFEPAQADVPSARPGTSASEVAKSEPPNSVAELSALIREFSTRDGNAADLYKKLVAIRLAEKAWWRNDDFSALHDLTTDAALDEHSRALALRLYLSGAPDAELKTNADSIQTAAMAAQDDMVSAVLQGMAERRIPTDTLTKSTLTGANRGTGAKCYAWYAARLTQKDDAELARLALAPPSAAMTESTKVAFDYLASGSFQSQFVSDPRFRQGVEESARRVKSLQSDAGPMDLANGDAFIRAVPSILPADAAVDSLLSMLRETPNPEMRLSAIEQLVSIHLSGTLDLSQELHEVRNQISTLFSDPVKQDRAKLRLNRIDTRGNNK